MRQRYLVRSFAAALLLVLLLAGGGRASESDPEVHRVLGSLAALSAAVNEGDGHTLPQPGQLKPLFEPSSLPGDWDTAVKTASADGGWWVGLKLDPYSSARKFLRAHAPELELRDGAAGTHWMGGAFVCIEAKKGNRALQLSVAQGEDGTLFWRLPGNGNYWWSPLVLTPKAKERALKRWGAFQTEGLELPKEKKRQPETFQASPVGLPDNITLSSDQDLEGVDMGGDVMFNPIPRGKNSD